MSYSMREPDWPVVCECTYDEALDEMDRENCPLHYQLVDEDLSQLEDSLAKRKQLVTVSHRRDEAAA